jgi:very-short-patch-repair endonuclease
VPKIPTVPYNAKLKSLARELRKRSTLAEVLLWQRLNGRRVAGRDFHRQRPVDEYILDFFSPELMLAIEIDGSSHRLKGTADENRQRRLEVLGIRLLRFKETEVRRNLDGVVRAIEQWIAAHHP